MLSWQTHRLPPRKLCCRLVIALGIRLCLKAGRFGSVVEALWTCCWAMSRLCKSHCLLTSASHCREKFLLSVSAKAGDSVVLTSRAMGKRAMKRPAATKPTRPKKLAGDPEFKGGRTKARFFPQSFVAKLAAPSRGGRELRWASACDGSNMPGYVLQVLKKNFNVQSRHLFGAQALW